MEIGLSDVESSQLSVRNPEAFLVDILVQTALRDLVAWSQPPVAPGTGSA
jgi:hypothetical protein